MPRLLEPEARLMLRCVACGRAGTVEGFASHLGRCQPEMFEVQVSERRKEASD